MIKTVWVFSILLFFVSCKKDSNKKIDVSNIEINFSVERFEQEYYNADKNKLSQLQLKFPYLFPGNNNDSIWLEKINDEEEQTLYKKSQLVFGNFEEEKKQIEKLFTHVKYYFPNFKPPKIITLITNLDYESKVIYADSLLFVSLDMYLGRESEVYHDFPLYLSQNFDKSLLTVDMAKAIGESFFGLNRNRQFLNVMIAEGKKMYTVDCFLPEVPDYKKMGYTIDKLDWVTNNEAEIWKYFMEKKLLYSTDLNLHDRFIATAPFSKFYIDIDKDSPGSVGIWLGWQIVRSYMKNNDVTLQQLLETDSEEIFKNSNYKPKK